MSWNLRHGIHILRPNELTRYVEQLSIIDFILIQKRLQSLKEHAKYLKLRPDEFETILRDIGFGPAQHLGTTGEGGQ